ncbi:MAG: hypothetical protein H7144_02910 [Burkholderiales bacterium]|nr:hypothetical protein [Phycisphaerae bacterium]
MLSTLKTILIVILLAGWAVAIASLHVVRTPDAVIGVIPKNRLGFADSYVDVRTWTAADAAAHPDLLRRLIATDKTHWLKHVGTAPELATILAKNSTTDDR